MTLAESNVAVTDAVQGEPGRDKYLPFELSLAALLFMLWRNSLDSTDVVQQLSDALANGSPADLETAIAAASVKLNIVASVEDGDDDEISRIISDALFLGAGMANQEPRLRSMNQVATYQRNVLSQVFATTNNYLLRVVAPRLREARLAQRDDPQPPDTWALRAKALVLRLLVNNAAYWRIVANQFTGKPHHYGILRGSLERGVLGYELVAVLDHRTSDICWELHGRQFMVADAVDHLERAAKMSIEQLPNVSPWAKLDDVKGVKSPDLVVLGVLVPPFHPSCRTTLKAILG